MTTVDRRQFLRGATGCGASAAAAAATAVTTAGEAEASLRRPPVPMPPKAVGLLFDSTLCIGCKACVSACKEANGMPREVPQHLAEWGGRTWDMAQDLSPKTLNVIRAYSNGTAKRKDTEADGFAFMKRSCLHCVDPSCVSVCPVSAMTKDPVTGIVKYDPSICIGCRYCSFGCPFGVPQFELDGAFGKVNKCQLCVHIQEKGGIPACADVCPTGATLFGPVQELQAEADRRLAHKAGDTYVFPRGKIGSDRAPHEGAIGAYQPAVYGVREGGGTQVRYLAGVSFQKLGLPKLPDHSPASVTEGIQHTLYKGLIAPFALLAGLLFFARRSVKQHDDEKEI